MTKPSRAASVLLAWQARNMTSLYVVQMMSAIYAAEALLLRQLKQSAKPKVSTNRILPRLPRNEVLDLLFGAFETHDYWSLKNLVSSRIAAQRDFGVWRDSLPHSPACTYTAT